MKKYYLGKVTDSAYNITKSRTLSWVFFTFFKLCKGYQIAQSISYCLELKFNLKF